MWLLSFIPTAILDLAVDIVLLIGIAGIVWSFFITSFIFPFGKTIVQIISILILVLGVYWKGGISVEKEWREKLKQAEDRAQTAEQKAVQANSKIEYVFKDKIVKVKEVQVVIQEKIKDVSVLIDKQCTITPETVNILNDAARNRVGETK